MCIPVCDDGYIRHGVTACLLGRLQPSTCRRIKNEEPPQQNYTVDPLVAQVEGIVELKLSAMPTTMQSMALPLALPSSPTDFQVLPAAAEVSATMLPGGVGGWIRQMLSDFRYPRPANIV